MKLKSADDLVSPDCPLVFSRDNLAEILAFTGWSQKELSERCGRSKLYVHRLLSGYTSITQVDSMAIRFAVIYAKVLECSDAA